MHLRLAFGPAFVPSPLSARSLPTLEARSFWPTSEPAFWQSEQQTSNQAGAGATCIAVVALLATAFRTRASSRPSRGHFKAVLLSEGSLELSSTYVTSSTFAGASLGKAGVASRSKVTVNSLKSCDTLYFRRYWQYKSRHRKNLRNRAYNIFQKNKYKKEMKKVLLYAEDLRTNDVQPESVDQVMSEIKEKLDEACSVIDAVAVQGVLHRNDAADCKERMCIYILKACVKKGLLTMPEDPFDNNHNNKNNLNNNNKNNNKNNNNKNNNNRGSLRAGLQSDRVSTAEAWFCHRLILYFICCW
ncbi:unnamed protein product [Polarella glacialis]|uniref:Uncharacterized protein n=1 Tax=Polarella glacialis TaxID=89957 RepID=A0A813L055_POLGL|nr:unnamed protein product [Polarella glacialis]